MNYSEFLKYIEENLMEVWKENLDEEEFDEDTYEISIHKVVKNNGIEFDGLTLRKKDQTISPNIYLNPYFEEYQIGKPINVIMEEIIYRHKSLCEEVMMQVDDLTNFEEVKNKIVLRLVNYEKNSEILKSCPHRKYLDLAVTFRYLASKDSMGVASSLISNTEFLLWNIDIEQLYHVALFNTMREFPWKMDSLAKVVAENIRSHADSNIPEDVLKEIEDMENGVSMYVLTNNQGVNGATCLLYDHVIHNFARVQECNVYVLPSSIHEVMLVPENTETKSDFLEELVVEANQSAVGLIDLLSDHIYYYDREKEKMYIYGQN